MAQECDTHAVFRRFASVCLERHELPFLAVSASTDYCASTVTVAAIETFCVKPGMSLSGRSSPYTALPGGNPVATMNGRFLPDTGPGV